MTKKLHRFYIPVLPATDNGVIDDPRIVHQVSRVLALQPKESFILFSEGTDDSIVELDAVTKKDLHIHTVQTVPQLPHSKQTLVAAISIPKRDVFEIIVQKLTELGVSEIIPIRSHRTIKQSVRLDRLQTISDEAMEQCGGNRRVRIHEPMLLEDCLQQHHQQAIVFDAEGSAMPTLQSSCMMYIGPEGGWSAEDRILFTNATIVTLGPRILRTDTAAIVGAFRILWVSL